MAIVESTIEAQILAAIEANNKEGEEGKKQFASDMAKIIADAIKSGTVTVAPGIVVQVTIPAGTGATVSTGTGTIS